MYQAKPGDPQTVWTANTTNPQVPFVVPFGMWKDGIYDMMAWFTDDNGVPHATNEATFTLRSIAPLPAPSNPNPPPPPGPQDQLTADIDYNGILSLTITTSAQVQNGSAVVYTGTFTPTSSSGGFPNPNWNATGYFIASKPFVVPKGSWFPGLYNITGTFYDTSSVKHTTNQVSFTL